MTCKIEQQQDEMCCGKCGIRWAVNEDQPECPTPKRIEQLERRLNSILNSGRILGADKREYQAITKELKELKS